MKVFLTENTGDIHLLEKPLSVDWTKTVNYVDVTSIGDYAKTSIPVSTAIDIQLVVDFGVDIPFSGIINVANGQYGYAVKYHLKQIEYKQYKIINLIGMANMLEGEHIPKIYVVRFDLGDGTYKQLYTHEREKDLVVERYYNKQNLWN